MANLYDTEVESDWIEARRDFQQRRQAQGQQITPDHAELVSRTTREAPLLAPGIHQSLAQAFSDIMASPEMTRALVSWIDDENAGFEADRADFRLIQNVASQLQQETAKSQKTWEEMSVRDRVFEGLKHTTRTGLATVMAPFDEFVFRPTVGVLAAGHRAIGRHGRGGFGNFRRLGQEMRDVDTPQSHFAELVESQGVDALFSPQQSAEGFGRGWLPGGDIEQIRQAQIPVRPDTGTQFTFGGAIADLSYDLGIVEEPGNQAHMALEAVGNIAFELGADPLLGMERSFVRAAHAARSFKQAPPLTQTAISMGIISKPTRTVTPFSLAEDWLDSKDGHRLAAFLAEEQSFEKIFNKFGSAEVASALTDAKSVDEVKAVLYTAAGKGEVARVPTPYSWRIKHAYTNSPLYQVTSGMIDALPTPKDGNYFRVGHFTPGKGASLSDPNDTAEQMLRWYSNMVGDKTRASSIAKRMSDAVADGDRVEARRIWRQEVQADTRAKLKEFGHNTSVIDSILRRYFDDSLEGTRAYWIEEVSQDRYLQEITRHTDAENLMADDVPSRLADRASRLDTPSGVMDDAPARVEPLKITDRSTGFIDADGKPISRARYTDEGGEVVDRNEVHYFLKHFDPHDTLAHAEEMIDFGDVTSLRRDTSTLSRLSNTLDRMAEHGGMRLGRRVGAQAGALASDAARAASHEVINLAWDTHDFLWDAQRAIFMPLALATRIAWPMRVVLDEQIRMTAVGMDSMFNHPLSYLSWALSDRSRIGNQFADDLRSITNGRAGNVVKDANLDPLHESDQFSRSQVHGRPNAYHGERVKPGQRGWLDVDTVKDSQTKVNRAVNTELSRMWRSDFYQRVARMILDPADNVVRMFEDMQKNGMLDDLKAMPNMEENFVTHEATMQYLESVVDRVKRITMADDDLLDVARVSGESVEGAKRLELLESVANRKLRGASTYDIKLDKKLVSDAIDEHLASKVNRRKLPRLMQAPEASISPGGWKARADRATAFMFYALGSAPSNIMSRSPAYKQLYWERMAQLAPMMDDATRLKLLENAKAANIPTRRTIFGRKADSDILSKIEKAASQPGPRSANKQIATDETVLRQAGSTDEWMDAAGTGIRSIEEADLLAREYGMRESNDLLYSLAEKGQVAEAMRLSIPFMEAYKELLVTYGKVLAKRPFHARRGQIIADGVTGSGFIYTDPTTEQDVYATAPGGHLERIIFGGMDPDNNIRTVAGASVMDLNFLTSSIVPGLGPTAAGVVATILPEKSGILENIRDVMLPYSSSLDDPEDWLDGSNWQAAFFPAWIRNLINSNTNGMLDDRQWLGTVNQVMKGLAQTGQYPATPEGAKRLEQDAMAAAKRLGTVQAIASALLPSSPRIDIQVRVDSPEAIELADAVIGDMPIGRTDDKFLSLAVLGAFYNTVQRSTDGDTLEAAKAVGGLLGYDPNSWDDLFNGVILGKGKSQATGAFAMSPEGHDWELDNPEILEVAPAIAGYFAEDHNYDYAFNLRYYLDNFDEGKSVPLEPSHFLKLTQRYLGSAIYNKLSEPLGDRNDVTARNWKAKLREDLDMQMPYWRWDKPIEGLGARTNTKGKIEELYKVIGHANVGRTTATSGDFDDGFGAVLDTPQGEATKLWLTDREKVINALIRDNADIETREQAETALRSRNSTQHLRTWLRDYGEELTQEYGGFKPIWKSILRFEVEIQSDEEVAE